MKEGNLPVKEFIKDTFSAMKMGGKRSLLSGAVTAWGIFIFVLIAGSGSGFDKGMSSNFDFFLQYGTISYYPGEIKNPANGLPKGRQIILKKDDADLIRSLFSDRAEAVYPRKQLRCVCNSTTGSLISSVTDFREGLDGNVISFLSGREMSKMEFSQGQRVCIIPQSLCSQLFDNPDDAIGKTIQIDGIPFNVVGVFQAKHNLHITNVFIPFDAAMSLHGVTNEISAIDVKLYKNMPADQKYKLKDDIKNALSLQKGFSKDDMYALHIEEQLEYISTQEELVQVINSFSSLLGILSLVMGIIGISSIIHLSVKDRTKEIAIRLVCGASHTSIFGLVLGEAVLSMLSYGSVGMVLASVILKIGTIVMESSNETAEWIIFGNMDVSFSLIMLSFGIIVLCGIIAGYAPAKKAVSTDISKALTSQ